MLVTGIVKNVKQKEDPPMYFLEMDKDKWISNFGRTTVKVGDKIEAEVEETIKGDKTYYNIKNIKVTEEKVETQETLDKSIDDNNKRYIDNLCLMTRCFMDSKELLKKHFEGEFVNPEVLEKVAITLFLEYLKKERRL